MAYPTKLLTPGETIKYELKPHWRALFWPGVILVVMIGVGVYLYAASSNQILHWIILAAALVILVWFVLIPFMRWITTQYVFTDRRIIIRRGLLTKQGRDVPLAKVNNVSFEQRFIGRMLNYGELQVESANADGSLYIQDVPNVEEIQRDVYRLQEEDDARRRGGSEESGTSQVLPNDGT